MKTARFPLPFLAIALLAALALSLGSCATTIDLPLSWKPTTKVADVQARIGKVDLAGAKVQFAKLEDTRKNPPMIGEQPDPKSPKTVTTKSNVGAWVAAHLADGIAQLTPGSGLAIVDKDPAVIVSGKVTEFFATEIRNTYEGTIALDLVVKKADGTELYIVRANGKTSRIAPLPFHGENFLEAYSNTVLQLAQSLVEDAKFRTALKGEKP